PPADEQNIRRVHLQELLLRVLAAALGRNVRHGAFDDFQKRLLHSFARDISSDGGVLALAGDLVDFIDVNNAPLGSLDVMVGRLQKIDDDVFDVLANVSSLRQTSGVGNGEGHVENSRQGLSKERLARAGGAEQKNIGLLQLDIVHRDFGLDALV